MKPRPPAGYTLIEIMIAVAILSIIAAIAIPAYRGYIQESRYGAALQDMRQMQLILDDLAVDRDLAALDADSEDIRGIYSGAGGAVVLGDPATTPAGATQWLDPWGTMYRYRREDNTTQDYVVWSFGPDGTDNSRSGDDAFPN
jgi:prepilin-type N-terminal cleavage/methylation domain-containing protein